MDVRAETYPMQHSHSPAHSQLATAERGLWHLNYGWSLFMHHDVTGTCRHCGRPQVALRWLRGKWVCRDNLDECSARFVNKQEAQTKARLAR